MDGSGSLSVDELTTALLRECRQSIERMKQMAKEADTLRADGFIDQEEYVSMMLKRRGSAKSKVSDESERELKLLRQGFSEMDLDNDGKHTIQELEGERVALGAHFLVMESR